MVYQFSIYLILVAFCMCLNVNALNPAIKLAGQGMQLIKPIFALENKLQGAVLGLLGNVDKDEVKAELANLKDNSLVIYTYGLSPFSTEAIAMLEEEGVTFEKRELGLEWFLLGPRASVVRSELLELTGQSSLPHIFINGEHIGGYSTGSPGLCSLVESGELKSKLNKAKASSKKKSASLGGFKLPF